MSNFNFLTIMILRKCRANYEELTSLINTGDAPLFVCICEKENDRGIIGWYNEEKPVKKSEFDRLYCGRFLSCTQ